MFDSDIVQQISVWALPVLLAATFHEAGHAFAAWRLGDDTAYRLGRVSLNPLRHVDPFGTIALPLLLLVTHAPFMYGYAKPAPVRPGNLRQPRTDSIWVALAGPAMNLLLAIASALLFRLLPILPDSAVAWTRAVLTASVTLNVLLAVFNMLPIPPLDGSRVLLGLLPHSLAKAYAPLFQYGPLLVIGIILLLPVLGRTIGIDLNIIGWLMGPPVKYLLRLLVPAIYLH